MKFLVLVSFCCFLSLSLMAQTSWENARFEVMGNCNMCKKTIEKAATVKGVKKAKWDKKTKILSVTFDPKQTGLDKIQLQIAAAGYDTPKYRANDETYDSLHSCCHYDRKK
ncbi:MAG: cation transporter [Saprospiraceae bacterium]|nr:cation transporter [Candidatus Vicinibacter affinis]MBK8405551.1 cation transporter [Candidatus Vicinibacter affinis]